MRCAFPVEEARHTLQKVTIQYKCPNQPNKFAETKNFLFAEFVVRGKVININKVGEAVNFNPHRQEAFSLSSMCGQCTH